MNGCVTGHCQEGKSQYIENQMCYATDFRITVFRFQNVVSWVFCHPWTREIVVPFPLMLVGWGWPHTDNNRSAYCTPCEDRSGIHCSLSHSSGHWILQFRPAVEDVRPPGWQSQMYLLKQSQLSWTELSVTRAILAKDPPAQFPLTRPTWWLSDTMESVDAMLNGRTLQLNSPWMSHP